MSWFSIVRSLECMEVPSQASAPCLNFFKSLDNRKPSPNGMPISFQVPVVTDDNCLSWNCSIVRAWYAAKRSSVSSGVRATCQSKYFFIITSIFSLRSHKSANSIEDEDELEGGHACFSALVGGLEGGEDDIITAFECFECP